MECLLDVHLKRTLFKHLKNWTFGTFREHYEKKKTLLRECLLKVLIDYC